MNSKIPEYIYEKSNIIQLVLFTAAFALFFINVFQPFGSRDWYPDISDFTYFFFSSLIILTGMLVIAASRFIMWKYAKNNEISYLLYVIWVFVEILAMSIFFSLFAKFALEGGAQRDLAQVFKAAITNTSLVLLLPYLISWLYLSWKDKNDKLLRLKLQSNAEPESHKRLISFPDEKGEIKITLAADNLLFIESADNYITIHYLNKAKLSRFLLRNSLKKLEELTQETTLVRCHRSYIINLDKVKVMRKTKDGIFLELDAINTPDIPVSKTFYPQVMEKFSQYST